MREFASDGRARSLSLPARILYTVFAALTLGGSVSCVVLYDSIVRFGARTTPEELRQRLSGHYDAMSRQQLVETTHAHLFSMPVLLLIAGHLFLLSSARQRVKVAAVTLACAATVVHLAAPWLVVMTGGHPAAAVIYPLSGGLLLLVYTVLLAVPVGQMWMTKRPNKERLGDSGRT
jgi:hypothetical protein